LSDEEDSRHAGRGVDVVKIATPVETVRLASARGELAQPERRCRTSRRTALPHLPSRFCAESSFCRNEWREGDARCTVLSRSAYGRGQVTHRRLIAGDLSGLGIASAALQGSIPAALPSSILKLDARA
jgi:hypothetical protein